ncbi:hypothetical protein SDRG_08699, partial [Saprolegnia diclina VS20]
FSGSPLIFLLALSIGEEAPQTTRKAFRFTVASDVDLLKEVMFVSPYDCQYGQIAKRWEDDDPEESDSAATPSKKVKKEGRGAIKDVASVVVDFTSIIESSNKLKQDEISAKKEETAVAQRRHELDEQRYLLEKAEREARFQLERSEREVQLEFIRSTIELMRSLGNKI